jgi:hypothetical protein
MLNIPESDPCDSGIPLSQHLHKYTEFLRIPEFRFLHISINARNSGITICIGLFTNDQSWLSIEFRYGIPGILRAWNRSGIGRNSHWFPEFRNHNLYWLVYEWSVLAIDWIPLRNSRNCKGLKSIRNWTEFPELEGILTGSRNSGITTYIGLLTNDQSWLSIEFRDGILGVGRTRNRSGIGRNSRNCKEFRNHNLHWFVYEWSVLAIDWIPLIRFRGLGNLINQISWRRNFSESGFEGLGVQRIMCFRFPTLVQSAFEAWEPSQSDDFTSRVSFLRIDLWLVEKGYHFEELFWSTEAARREWRPGGAPTNDWSLLP